MGQKINPIGLRKGILGNGIAVDKGGIAHWRYGSEVSENQVIENLLGEVLKKRNYLLARCYLNREMSQITVYCEVAGQGGEEELKKELAFCGYYLQRYLKKNVIFQVKWPSVGALLTKTLIAELRKTKYMGYLRGLGKGQQMLEAVQVLGLLEKGSPGRAALLAEYMTKVLEETRVGFFRERVFYEFIADALSYIIGPRGQLKGGIIQVKGRIQGAEKRTVFKYRKGAIPLHTLRAAIDYGCAEGLTAFGICSVKVWLNYGVVAKKENVATEESKI